MLQNKTHLVRSESSCQFLLSEEIVIFPDLTLCAMLSMSCEAVLLLLEEDSQSVGAGHDSVNAGCSSVAPEWLFWVPSSFWLF